DRLNSKPRQKLDTVLTAIKEEARGQLARRYLDRVDLSPNLRAYLAQELEPHWTDRIRVLSDPPLKWEATQPGTYLVAELFEVVRETRRKAHVGVITNSLAANDVVAVHGGYANYRKRLLRTGVKLYEMRPQVTQSEASLFGSSGASLHTKA